MAAEWEYTVVRIDQDDKLGAEQARTELINRVAEYGWRLLAITSDPGSLSRTYAYFERRADQSDE